MLIKKERALKISPPLKIPILLCISHHFIAKVTMGISWTLQCYWMVKYQCCKTPSSLFTDDKAMLRTQDWAPKWMHSWFYVMTATHLGRRETTYIPEVSKFNSDRKCYERIPLPDYALVGAPFKSWSWLPQISPISSHHNPFSLNCIMPP